MRGLQQRGPTGPQAPAWFRGLWWGLWELEKSLEDAFSLGQLFECLWLHVASEYWGSAQVSRGYYKVCGQLEGILRRGLWKLPKEKLHQTPPLSTRECGRVGNVPLRSIANCGCRVYSCCLVLRLGLGAIPTPSITDINHFNLRRVVLVIEMYRRAPFFSLTYT